MKIKVCGLTSKEEAKFLNQYSVDFSGFILFFPKSKRNISIEQAREIMKELNPAIKKVAVVVSPTIEQAMQICEAGFDYIQIHGELSEELLANITLPILKAFNIKDMEQYSFYQSCPQIHGYVFDAAEPGSGQVFDWNLISQIPKDDKLFFLAGGLHPGNVCDAITTLHPDGVDVSSGVEYGKEIVGKDPDKIKQFVQAVRSISPEQHPMPS